MDAKNRIGERGQTLVWVALSLIGMITLISMAVDLGLVYSERRNMQNAADAGALAGARELCLGNSETAARNRAWEYTVVRNQANNAAIAINGNKVTVVAEKNVRLFFWGITGFSQIYVTADATAACGAVRRGCGLWPVAFKRALWQELWGRGCGREFIVWDDEKTDVDCNVYNCDLDGDGRDDIIVGGDRGWLDLSTAVLPYANDCTQPGCGANEIRCLIENNSGAMIDLPKCISGDSGVKAGVANAVDSRAGDVVAIPLYESVGCRDPLGNCPGGLGYWVTSVGCVTVIKWERKVELEPKDPDSKKPTLIGKGIRVRMDCNPSCMTMCGSTDGSRPPESWEYGAVSLIE